MATTSFSHTDAYINFSAIDFSGQSNTCELTVDQDLSEVTAFGEAADEFVENTYTWTISVAGFTDNGAADVENELYSALGAGEQDVIYAPQGAATGYKFTGKALLKSFGVGGGLKTGCPYSAVFQGNGAVSRTACP